MKKLLIAMTLLGAVACQPEPKATDPAAGSGPKAQPAKKSAEPENPAKGEAAAKDEASAKPAGSTNPDGVAMTATVGKPAPDFSLKDQDGNVVKLSDLKGSVVVLEWTCPTCPYVVRHYEKDTMQKTFKGFPADKVKWLAIDSSHFVEQGKTVEWKKKEGFDYPVLLDKDGAVGRAYNAKTTPHMFVVDAAGVLRYDGAIDNDPHGDAKDVTNYVEGAVKALLDGKEVPSKSNKPYGCSVKYKS